MCLIKIFGKNVKKYRQNMQLSQEKLAELTDLHRNYIGDIECCRKSATIKSIEKIALALNVEPYILFIDEDEEN